MRAACLLLSVAIATPARADQTLTFDAMVDDAPPDHVTIELDVPAGTREIQVDHDDMAEDDILDWGLEGPSGSRGWGGGNTESIIVNELAATRSYHIGPIEPGRWRVWVGKAKLAGGSASYHVVVTLRDAPTLAPQPERSPYAATAPLSTEARWYAGDFHVHSRESGDARATFDEIIALATSRGLDFVEISDHNTTSQLDFLNDAQARAGKLLLMPGVEYTTYDGHANGIGATRFVEHKLAEGGATIDQAADAFHAQGALFAINHPAFDLGDACIGCSWGHPLAFDKIDAVEVVTAGSAQVFFQPTSQIWEEIAQTGRRVAAIGGSDDHRAGVEPGAFGTPIGSPTTMVFAEELSTRGILDGIRAGRTVVKVRGPEDPMVEVQKTAGGPLGVRIVATITGGAGKEARFVVDGAPLDTVLVDSDAFDLVFDAPTPTAPRRVRVEVLEAASPVTLTSHVWIEPTDGASSPQGGGCAAAAAREAPPGSGAFIGAAACAALAGRRRKVAKERTRA